MTNKYDLQVYVLLRYINFGGNLELRLFLKFITKRIHEQTKFKTATNANGCKMSNFSADSLTAMVFSIIQIENAASKSSKVLGLSKAL